MKFYIRCISLVFCSMLFLPCVSYNPDNSEVYLPDTVLPKPVAEATSISLLDTVSNKTVSMGLEEYIEGVVLAEMPASYGEEALKAQAVAARTYAVSRIKNPAHGDAAICTNSTCCCAYIFPGDYLAGEEYKLKVKNAVAATAGEIMTFDGEPIVAAFHAMSAGKTASAKNVWGSDLPYLTAVDSSFEASEENFKTELRLSFPDFAARLSANAADCKATTKDDISEPVRDESGYVSSIVIGGHTFSGNEIRSIFSLRSSCFYIASDSASVTFTVYGYGHGVGMSQHGAAVLAKEGKRYDEILKSYYSGVNIVNYKA